MSQRNTIADNHYTREARMDIIAKASEFAAAKHVKQRRKYMDQPYFNHLAAVVRVLESNGVTDPTVLAPAYLHDTVEDTDATMQEIVAEFGADVAELVYWLTDAEKGNRESRTLMSAWRLSRAPFRAKLIKFADILDNCASIRAHDPNFFKVFAAETALILTRMLEVEGSGLADNILFKPAWNAATSGLSRPS